MASGLVVYQYIGGAAFFQDAHTGSRQQWRYPGDEQGIDPAFMEKFDRLYVDCENPVMVRVTPADKAAKMKPDKRVVPGGTPYSGYSYEQLKVVYTTKTGLRPDDSLTAVAMVEAIQQADARNWNRRRLHKKVA